MSCCGQCNCKCVDETCLAQSAGTASPAGRLNHARVKGQFYLHVRMYKCTLFLRVIQLFCLLLYIVVLFLSVVIIQADEGHRAKAFSGVCHASVCLSVWLSECLYDNSESVQTWCRE